MSRAIAAELHAEVSAARGDETTLAERLKKIDAGIRQIKRQLWLVLALVVLSGRVSPEMVGKLLQALGAP